MSAAAMRVAAYACPRDLRIKPEVLVKSGQVRAVTTDNRPDEQLERFHVFMTKSKSRCSSRQAPSLPAFFMCRVRR